MRQNAYTFRRPSYNTNSTPVLNKKISLPPAFQEYTPVMTFRNNFSTPAMSGMRGLQSMPGLNITPDVANDAYVSFKFNVPIIADIKEAEIARREVKTMPMTVTISMLNSLPSIQLVAIANQLINLPASNARSSFISVVYKLLKDMVAMPGPPAGDRKVMLTAIDNLETVQPAVLIPPIVILPAGAVGVVVPPGGAPPGGAPAVPPGPPGGAPAVPPGPPGGAPAVPPGVPAVVLTPVQEIKQAISDLFINSTFTKGELDDIKNKVDALTDAKERQQYEDTRQDMMDAVKIYEDIKVLGAKGWGDQPVQDIDIEIKNIKDPGFIAFLNGALDSRMNFLGVGPRPGGPAGPPAPPPGPPGGAPPAGGPELIYTYDELKRHKDNKAPEYKNFINSIDTAGVGFYRPTKDKWPAVASVDRKQYVDDWKNNNTATGAEYKTLVKGQMSRTYAPGGGPDTEGRHSNKRGFIHYSIR